MSRAEKLQAPITYMDSERIGDLDSRPIDDGAFMVNAVLFGTGEFRRVKRSVDVYSLILAGYSGMRFTDEDMYTAIVASELPIYGPAGIRKVQKVVDGVVRVVMPDLIASFGGYILPDEAAAHVEYEVKSELGLVEPGETFHWQGGCLRAIE